MGNIFRRECQNRLNILHSFSMYQANFFLAYCYTSVKVHVKNFIEMLVCATTATAVLHHHMSLTCCIDSHCTPAALAQAHTTCLFAIDLHTVRQHLVIVHFLLLILPSGTLFQMMSGVPHYCHHISLVLKTYLFHSVYKD